MGWQGGKGEILANGLVFTEAGGRVYVAPLLNIYVKFSIIKSE